MAIVEDLLAGDPKNKQYQIDLHTALRLEIELNLLAAKYADAHRLTERALRFLEPLVRSAGPSELSLFDYASILIHTPFSDEQNPSAALEAAVRAAKLTQESDPETLELLALAWARVGQPTQSIEILQKALALVPAPKPGDPVPELRRSLSQDLADLRR